MGFKRIDEERALIDDATVSFDQVPAAAAKESAVAKINKGWATAVSALSGLNGLSPKKPDMDAVADALIKSNTHAVMFELVLTQSEFRLDVIAGKVTWNAGKVSVPSEREKYREFIGKLQGWSNSSRNIMPDADFNKFNEAFPKKPTYKDYDSLAKNKDDLTAFRTWAKNNTNGKKACDAIDKSAKAKSGDPARQAALKAIYASMLEWYKTFD